MDEIANFLFLCTNDAVAHEKKKKKKKDSQMDRHRGKRDHFRRFDAKKKFKKKKAEKKKKERRKKERQTGVN